MVYPEQLFIAVSDDGRSNVDLGVKASAGSPPAQHIHTIGGLGVFVLATLDHCGWVHHIPY